MNKVLETMLKTMAAMFSPQIVAALGDVLAVAERYDARLERVEKMVGELLLRDSASDAAQLPAITERSDARE